MPLPYRFGGRRKRALEAPQPIRSGVRCDRATIENTHGVYIAVHGRLERVNLRQTGRPSGSGSNMCGNTPARIGTFGSAGMWKIGSAGRTALPKGKYVTKPKREEAVHGSA